MKPTFKHGTYIDATETDPLKRKEELQSILDYLKSKGEEVYPKPVKERDDHVWYGVGLREWGACDCDNLKNHPLTFQELKAMFGDGEVKMTFGLTHGNLEVIKKYTSRWEGAEFDRDSWVKIGEEIGWEPFTACLWYFRNQSKQTKIKPSDIISVTTSEGTFTNFEIVE